MKSEFFSSEIMATQLEKTLGQWVLYMLNCSELLYAQWKMEN